MLVVIYFRFYYTEICLIMRVWWWRQKQVDVVISDINHSLLGDQVKIIDAIKEAGNVKVGNLIWVNELLTWLMFCHSGFILDWDLIVFL